MSEKLYYRLCIGLTDVGKFYPIEKSPYEVVKNLDQEIFKSVFYYTEDQVKEAEKEVEVIDKKTGEKIKRIRGVGNITLADGSRLQTLPAKTNQLIFDFDSENIEESRKDALTLIDRLNGHNLDVSNFDLCFSGGKGFHCKIQTNEYFTSPELKAICSVLMDGLNTSDTRVYNDARILRLPYSKHKSGLYTTPLEYDELLNLSIDEIKDLASNKYSPEEFAHKIDLPQEIIDLKNTAPVNGPNEHEVKIVASSFEDLKEHIDKIDYTKKMPYMPAAKWVLQQGYIPNGYGQEARMILASTYKAMGYDEHEAYYALKSVSQKRAKLLGKNAEFDKYELWDNVIGTVYSPQWNGGTYGIENPLLKTIDELLPPFLRYNGPAKSVIMSNDDAFDNFVHYAENIDKNTIGFGIKSLDENIRIMTKNVYGLLASPGVGKTSIALQIMENTSLDKNNTKYFSFDMSNDDTIEKIMIRHTRKDGKVIMEEIKNGTKEEREKYRKILQKRYENVDFIFKPGMTIEEMETAIRTKDRESGDRTRLIVVDYLTLIKTTATDPTAKTEEAIQGLRYLAHTLDIAVFVLLQPNKANSTPNESITSYNGIKGSSAIAEACSAIFTAYREGFDPKSFQNDKYFGLICVKNRKGKLFSLDFHWEGKPGLIRELEDIEKKELADFRQAKEEEKAEKAKQRGNGW